METARSSNRIVIVDCLRGFALMGLFIVHMVEYFELFWYAPEWGWVHNTVFFMFGGKAYAIFALLFGLSFFIIMDNQAKRGVDFRGRFSWRLTLLLAMGYVHGLLYSGDILQVLALSGFLLILIYPLSNKWILLLAAACLLQTPLLVKLALLATGEASAEAPRHWALMAQTFEIYANGSFLEVLQRNVWLGQLGKWGFMVEGGRIWNVVGLFLVGFHLGRIRFFENYRQYLHICFATVGAILLLLLVTHTAQVIVSASSLQESVSGLAGEILKHYSNNLLTALGVMLFLLAYQLRAFQTPINWLAAPGRMSLTIYVSQSLYGVPLFYGFGLALYQGFGQVPALLLGLVLWTLQVWLAHVWIKHYHYGPLEWIWRAATYMSRSVKWKRTG